jgi:LPS sulfotransferase NodH
VIKIILTKLKSLPECLIGDTNYEKFVVIARARTGSNLLLSLLNNHQQIRAFGEKFSRLGNKNTKLIFNEIFPKKSTKTIGFKLFYYHPIDSEDKSIWEILKNDTNFKIIHLQRKNVLRTHISELIARKLDLWTDRGRSEIGLVKKKININVDEFYRVLEKNEKQIEKVKNKFQQHKMIDVFYEDLVDNRSKTMERVFDFLNVSNHDSKTDLIKQNPEKMNDLIMNYEELVEKLINSKYSFMLEE